jgi:outer membrane biosynthesis protein TonB
VKLRIHLFEWPSRHNVHLVLPIMLFVSFLLHAASLFIFQATFPSSQGSRERSAVVYHLLPGSPDEVRIAPMLAASDPALFSPAKIFGREAWRVPKTVYSASFEKEIPALAPLPAPPASQFLPPVPGTAPVAAATFVSKPSPRHPAVPTAVRFGGDLKGRSWSPSQHFDVSALSVLSRQVLAPAEFLVAVAPDGLVMHLFPQQSSGNENLDRAALRYLAGGRFDAAPSAQGLAWGSATFAWGAGLELDSQR